MRQKNNGKSAEAFKFLVFVLFVLLVSETAFAQVSGLTLNNKSDIRYEAVYAKNSAAVTGYNLYVRKKPGMESVMLTEPSGYYALRTLERHAANDAIRNLSGKRLTDTYSRYSIISSTPIHDGQFGRAFKLFIPSTVFYGNPSAACGIVPLNTTRGIHFNIRTFDQKYGDPNRSTYKNTSFTIGAQTHNTIGAQAHNTRGAGRYESAPPNLYTSPHNADALKQELYDKITSEKFLEEYNDDLRDFLIYMFWELERRGL